MKSRQSHKPRGKKKSKGSLRFAEGKRSSAVGQTSRQSKQFASGIMGKYGWDRNNYLGMFALIFKSKGLLTDKELAAMKSPSDRSWVLQLQLQLESLKHPESAPFITKQQTIRHIEKLVTQSGYRLPKQFLLEEKQQDEVKRLSSESVPVVTDAPVKKKRGRKSKKEKELASQLLREQENVHVVKDTGVLSEQVKINVVNKRNSPMIARSMRQVVASISMLAHSTSSKMTQPSPKVNGVQHTSHTTNISQKALHLLYKQALREGNNPSASRVINDAGNLVATANHHSVAQHVDAIRNTSVWLEKFQSGNLSLRRSEDTPSGDRKAAQTLLQTNPSFLQVARLILQEVTQTHISQGSASQPNSFNMPIDGGARSDIVEPEAVVIRKALRLGEGPFTEGATPQTVRFIRSLLRKHAEGQDVQASKPVSAEKTGMDEDVPVSRIRSSAAKGFLVSNQLPLAINAASLTSRLPRSMHATAGTTRSNGNGMNQSTSSITPVWRKTSEPDDAAVMQRVLRESQEQTVEMTEVIQRLQQERDELQLLASESNKLQVMEQRRIQQEHQVLEEQRMQQEELQERVEQKRQVQQLAYQENEQNALSASRQRQEQEDRQPQEVRQANPSQQELVEQQEIQYKNQLGIQYEQHVQQIDQRKELQQEKQELQAKQEQHAQQLQEQQVEQPVKRKRGRPRKNSGVVQTSKETVNETNVGLTESVESSLTPPRAEIQEKLVPDLKADRTPEKETVASSQVETATAYPSPVYRKPARSESRRSTTPKIQSNENWLQQLVTIQRQPSSNNDSFIRSTNSVNRDGVQVVNDRAPATHLLNNVVKTDLGTEVLARSTSKLKDQSVRDSSAIVPRRTGNASNMREQRGSQQLHRQQEKRVVDHQSLQSQLEIRLTDEVASRVNYEEPDLKVRGEFPQSAVREMQENTRNPRQQQQPKQTQQPQAGHEVQLERTISELRNKQSAQNLALEIAAKIAEASIRSTGTLLLTPTRLSARENREVLHLLRTTFRQSESSYTGSAGQRQLSVQHEDHQGLVTQRMTIRPTLAADIAAKSAQSLIPLVHTSNETLNGTQLLQRKARKPASSVEGGRSSVSTEPLRVSWMNREAEAREVRSSVKESSDRNLGSDITNDGLGKPTSLAPLEIVRRAGSPSRVNRVKEQQANIQRKIDLGQFVSRQPSQSSPSPIISASSDGSATLSRMAGTLARSQLILRAGRVEDRTISRRASGSGRLDDTQQLGIPSVVEHNSLQRSVDGENDKQSSNSVNVGLTSEPVSGDKETQTSSVGMNGNQGSKTDGQVEHQPSVSTNQSQTNQYNGDVDSQFSQSVREVVRGELVQKSSNLSFNTKSQSNNMLAKVSQNRSKSSLMPGTLIQRSLGLTGGLQVRRANQADIAQQRSGSAGFVRDNLVQRSSGILNNGNTRQDRMEQSASGQMAKTINSEIKGIVPPEKIAERMTSASRDVETDQGQMRGRDSMISSHRIQRTSDAWRVSLIGRASEPRMRQLISKSTVEDIRQGAAQRSDSQASSPRASQQRREANMAGAQAEHVQRRVVDGSERAPMREAHGLENHVGAERSHMDSAEQTIRAMLSAQIDERSDPAAASLAAETVQGARSARAPRARQRTSMTPRVMPLLASSAGALRAAPAGMAAASPAAAEHRLPALGTGSLTTQAAASGRAAAPTAGVQRTASITHSSSQGWAAAAVTKPLPMQVQRQRKADGPPGPSATNAPMQLASIGTSHTGTPSTNVPMQTLTQPPPIGASHQAPLGMPVQPAKQEHLAAPISMLEHKQAPTSQLANTPLEMDWLRTKTNADQEPTVAPVEQTPPELSEVQLQELIKQLPQLDISKIADKVYREIEKKMKFERQRRGI